MHRQGRQAAAGADRRRGGALGGPLPPRRRGKALLGQRSSLRVFVNARGGGPGLTPRRVLEDPQGLCAAGRPQELPQPAHAPALVRHAPAGTRRRSPRHPDDAGPRRPVDDADLHARARASDAGRLRLYASSGARNLSRDAAMARRLVIRRVLAGLVLLRRGRHRPAAAADGRWRCRRLQGPQPASAPSTSTPPTPTAPAPPTSVAAAAARAGLSFIVLTDHGDAMRAVDSPRYRSGVAGHRRGRGEHGRWPRHRPDLPRAP